MMLTAILNTSRHAFAGLALVAGLTLAGQAEAWTEWSGGGYVSDFRNCEADGWQAGTTRMIRARYRPSGLPQNSNFSRLTFLFDLGAQNYSTTRGRFSNRFRPVQGAAIFTSAWTFEPDPQLRMITHQPRSISTDTDTIRLVGAIRNFNGVGGCFARFEVILTRRD